MKKIIYVFLFLPIIGFCQDNFNDYNEIINELKINVKDDKKKNKVHRLEVGLNGGLNIANLRDFNPKDGVNFDNASKLGNLYGGTIVYNFNRFLCVKGDFDIASKGFEVSNFDIGSTINPSDFPILDSLKNYKQFLNYFDIPAFFHLGFGKKLKFDINFGPYLSFLLRDRSNLMSKNPDTGNWDVNEGSLIDGLDNIDWGFTYGLGIDYHLTKRISIGFDFLIEQGQKLLTGASIGDFKNYSQDFDFGVNFLLFEKKKKKLF